MEDEMKNLIDTEKFLGVDFDTDLLHPELFDDCNPDDICDDVPDREAEIPEKQGNDITELVFILDKSGSMEKFVSDVVGGFNSMIESQKKTDKRVFVTTVLFSTDYQLLHDHVDIRDVKPLTEEDYVAEGCTSMCDAIGKTIAHMHSVRRYLTEECIPERTLVVINTDGKDNASRMYRKDKIVRMIQGSKRYGWEFIFSAANLDAGSEAESIGIPAENSIRVEQSRAGYRGCHKYLKACVCNFVEHGTLDRTKKN